jgi:hypothetical protein
MCSEPASGCNCGCGKEWDSLLLFRVLPSCGQLGDDRIHAGGSNYSLLVRFSSDNIQFRNQRAWIEGFRCIWSRNKATEGISVPNFTLTEDSETAVFVSKLGDRTVQDTEGRYSNLILAV